MTEDAIIAERSLFKGWLDLVVVTLRLEGAHVERGAVRHPSGASVLAFDPERRVALTVRQSRAGVMMVGAPTLAEAIGGVSEDGDGAETAKKEAWEEAGVLLGPLERVAHVWLTPSTTTERVELFLAPYRSSDRLGIGGGLADENERLEVREEPLTALWTPIETGAIIDSKLFMLLQALRLRRPELFATPRQLDI